MKLATIHHGGRPSVSIVDSAAGLYWPLAEIQPDLPLQAQDEMPATIGYWARIAPLAPVAASGHKLAGAKIMAPILAPPHNIMCVGKNYRAHAHEFTRSGFDAGAKAE
ncbi:MAG TPA: hydrolase, partial [Acidisoma sp.]|nr:hydrolase [Acidisoma sp.]